jgi:HEAT repeat protein
MRLFGDTVEELRDLSFQVLNQAMRRLSGYGVKRILPMLIEGCNDSNSRSKLSNLSALGSIAYCASKQLASCLPEIVPKLTVATVDTNPQIKEAAIKSLNQLLSTIKTPEIVDIRETLINALSRPYDENGRALEILLNTEFKHLFDTSSIALVMPVILYGLKNNRDSKQREDVKFDDLGCQSCGIYLPISEGT